MTGKVQYGPYNVTQGGVGSVVEDPAAVTASAVSGLSEPTWPTNAYGTVHDGGIIWTAIYARVIDGAVTSVVNQQMFQHNQRAHPDAFFQYGTFTWLTGANAGISSAVRDSRGVSATQPAPYLFLMEMMPNQILPGDTFTATVGCPKTRLYCQDFNNLDNHRAFPDMPTEDRALSTPNISAQGYAPKTTK